MREQSISYCICCYYCLLYIQHSVPRHSPEHDYYLVIRVICVHMTTDLLSQFKAQKAQTTDETGTWMMSQVETYGAFGGN